LSLSGHRILVVEDEIIIAMQLEGVLLDAGAEVIGPAMSASEACDLIDTNRITVAILDVRLSMGDSLAVAQRLVADGIPFIFHTGNAERLRASPWPQAPVVRKPAAPEVLTAAVAAAARKA
jgi:DNA-binding response OmpR family regulator